MDEALARDVLMQQGWLSLMPAEFAASLMSLSVWRYYAANEPIYAAGDPPGGIYGIAAGSVAFTAAMGSPASPVLHVGRAVSWTGVGPLLSGQPRRASLVAVAPVCAAYVPLRSLRSMLDANPAWWKHIAQELLMEFDTVTTAASDATIPSSTRRCAATLLRLADSRFDRSPSRDPSIQLSQEQIGRMMNLSRSSTSTVLARLADQGLIKLGFRAIELVDIDGLRAVADGD
jgi:CRP-like cAMP-binding protein